MHRIFADGKELRSSLFRDVWCQGIDVGVTFTHCEPKRGPRPLSTIWIIRYKALSLRMVLRRRRSLGSRYASQSIN